MTVLNFFNNQLKPILIASYETIRQNDEDHKKLLDFRNYNQPYLYEYMIKFLTPVKAELAAKAVNMYVSGECKIEKIVKLFKID